MGGRSLPRGRSRPFQAWLFAGALGLLVAVLDVRLVGARVLLVLGLTVLAGACAWVHPHWPWRWGLASGSGVTLHALATGFAGPYAHDRADALYALVPALAAAYLRGALRARSRSIWAPALVLAGALGVTHASQEREGGGEPPGEPGYLALEDPRFAAATHEVRPLAPFAAARTATQGSRRR